MPSKKQRLMGRLFEKEDTEKKRLNKKEELAQRVAQEIRIYKEMNNLLSTGDPVAFWRDHATKFPVLSSVVAKYLCAQASSTPRERMFSPEGYKLSHERSRLNPAEADMLIFLNKNATC